MGRHSRLLLTWVGHSTVLVDMDGVRLLTDPVLRTRVAHLRRVQPVDTNTLGRIDAVLVSHGHYDHLDVPSLRKLDGNALVLAPRGFGAPLRRAGRKRVEVVDIGEEVAFGAVTVRATQAEHSGGGGLRKGEALGFAIRGSRSAYFAGDTDLFDEMADLSPIDVALLPVWGWGPDLGEGHLDPTRAASAAALLRARTAIPIHWGTYYPVHKRRSAFLTDPPLDFRRAVAKVSPDTRVEILGLGETLEIESAGAAR
jgi:L-ascorbate metabolism protein UlaG (beta-lactamase superfamily)